MSTTESLTHKWLRQNVQTYQHKDTVFADVDTALARYITIRPKTDVYTYDDGRTQLLLCLHGLLPIQFRGAAYNIPVAIWITREYPRQPPIAYVVPTNDMLVRSGKHMDVSGRCQIDYLRDWERKSEGRSLVALLEAMQDVFSREPPVYAKPKALVSPQPQPAQPHASGTDYAARPPPPIPGAHTPTEHNTPPPPAGSPRHDGRPRLPAKPVVSAMGPSPGPSTTSSNIPPGHRYPDSRSESPNSLLNPSLPLRPPPPLPQHSHVDSSVTRVGNTSIPPTYTPRQFGSTFNGVPSSAGTFDTTSPETPVRANLTIQDQRSVVQTPQQYGPSSVVPGNPSALAYVGPNATVPSDPTVQHQVYSLPVSPAEGAPAQPPYPGAPPPFVTLQPTAYFPPNSYAAPLHAAPPPPSYISQAHVPASQIPRPAPPVPPPDLLDGDEPQVTASPVSLLHSAPPRPPNPELLRLHTQVHDKLSSELASLTHAMGLDAERLRAMQADLLAGEPALRDEMARLEAVRDVCRGVAARFGAVVDAGARNVAELRRKGDPEVDELVCSTTIVYNQLVDLVAEDNAIEDTVYHLHRALNTGRINLERFLRTTRVLAEEQFLKRALIEKILAGVSFGDMTWSPPPEWR
ncbi:UEV-domain-containing protein [Obba rivulosa]|uniref:UEV-domain-containing protein n=1 Tax=Obba rivulosa TaxID=1052685 RepID=A0A8E2DTG2_9APHY|nr:UEV-domain-containing protein [Obba rivulosa]